MRAHLGRVGSYSEHRSNLRERHSHDVMEIDGFALVGRQSRKRLDDDLPFLDGMGTRSISTARVLVGLQGFVLRLVCLSSRCCPSGHLKHVTRDGEQPGTEGTRRQVGLSRAMNLKKDLLNEVVNAQRSVRRIRSLIRPWEAGLETRVVR